MLIRRDKDGIELHSGWSRQRDRFVKAGFKDDRQTFVAKSSDCISAACGCLGDGRAVLVYVVVASGE